MQTELASAVSILSAMITPAVLISACGSLIIATFNRLSRMIDRTRKVSEQFRETMEKAPDGVLAAEERTLLWDQMARATRRSRLLQKAMTRLYMALAVFVATSVAIGIVAVTGEHFAVIPIALGLAGAGLLFSASVHLIVESRIALTAIHDEMDFVLRAGHEIAPSELVERGQGRRWPRWRGR